MSTGTRREPGRARSGNPTPPNLTQPDLTRPDPTRLLSRKEAVKASCETSDTPFLRQVRINTHLFETIKNAVASAISGENYSYLSAADFIRDALREHLSGGRLKRNVEKGPRKAMSLRLNEELKNFWDSLPARERQNILERAIRTKLASGG